MNESSSQKRSPDRFQSVLIAWVVCFSAGTSWESAFRILAEHTSWGVGQTISFMVNNLVVAVVCSVLLAVLHQGLIIVAGWMDKEHSISRKFLWPEIGLAAATLLGMSLWIVRYRFPLRQTPVIVQGGLLVLILILVYMGCMMVARLLHRHVLSRVGLSLLVKISIFAILGPIGIVFVAQWVRNSGHPALKRSENSVDRVVLISVDTLRCDFISAYGSPYIRTPVIDQIAAEGALFKQAVSLIPETAPSHMSMLTGLSPLTHGVHINGYSLPKGIPTVTTYLRKAGFRTGGFVSGNPLQDYCRLDRGFQRYDDNFCWIDFFDGSYCGRFVADLPFLTRDLARDAPSATDSALKWLKKNVDSPFFLFLHYYDPHFPYGGHVKSHHTDTAAPEDLPHQKKLYGIEVETVDAQIGRMITFLKEKGVYDNCLLIFTSDHGESLGEHGQFYGHTSLYEPVIRVPLIVRYPGKIVPGTVITQQVALTDIFRTILEATKVESKQAPNSIDLVGLANARFDSPHRVLVSNSYRKGVKHSVRTNEWKLIRSEKNQKTYELYHLSSDPSELINIYSREIGMARQLEPFLNRQLGLQLSREVDDLSPAQIENLKALGYVN